MCHGFVEFDCGLSFLWVSFGFCCLRFVLFLILSWLIVFVGFGFCFILTTAQYCPFWNSSFFPWTGVS